MNISMKEVKKHKKQRNAWIVIHNDVYDVSKFMDEHPGGSDPLVEYAGKDGTIAFEDVGHSEDAREMMKKYKIGTLPPNEHKVTVEPCCKGVVTKKPSGSATPRSCKKEKSPTRLPVEPRVSTIIVPIERPSNFWLYVLLALAVAAGGAFAAHKYYAAA